MGLAVRSCRIGHLTWSLKGCAFCLFASILLSFVHLLLELLGFFFIQEGESSKAILKLKRMKKRPVLVVEERIVDFLIPYDTSIGAL